MEHGYLIEHDCQQCGKQFIPTSMWVYKRTKGNVIKYFCSWHCLKEWDEAHVKKNCKPGKHKDEIIELLESGMSRAKVAEQLGVSVPMVAYYAVAYDVGRHKE